jgi:phosphatidylglycerol:prolipoprotein diacylglycerol transferase
MAGVVGAFIGARIYYVVFHNLNPENETKYTFITAITGIRDGGLAIYGGVIGALLFAYVFMRLRKLKILPVLDLAGLGFLLGIGIGRWGNFFNQEAFGAVMKSDMPWGMTGSRISLSVGSFEPVHPCFLYESLWCILGFFLLRLYAKKLRSFDGEIILLFAAWYGAGRVFIEALRTDSLMLGSVRISQVLAAVSAGAAIGAFVYFKRRFKADTKYAMYCNTEESAASIAAYEENLRLKKEKAEAKKAMKENAPAPSILAGDGDPVVPETEAEDGENS